MSMEIIEIFKKTKFFTWNLKGSTNEEDYGNGHD